MAAVSGRIIDRSYPPIARRVLQGTMAIALIIFVIELVLIREQPALGLRLLWFATIPLAPMILLVAPNAWVSVCPISTVQTLSHRLFRNPVRKLSPKATSRLQAAGWLLMLGGIPTRHIVFNTVGAATFMIALVISGAALVIGMSTASLSGWCVGLCPIRPIEILYGQFALDRRRPEKCTECSGCIASCHRLMPERSHNEMHRDAVIANAALGFPGFIAGYFLLDLLNLCNTEHLFLAGAAPVSTSWIAQVGTVYGVMGAGFVASWAFFRMLGARLKNDRALFRAVALSAFSAYYLGVAPEIAEAWRWPLWSIPLLLVPPIAALVWVTRPAPPELIALGRASR